MKFAHSRVRDRIKFLRDCSNASIFSYSTSVENLRLRYIRAFGDRAMLMILDDAIAALDMVAFSPVVPYTTVVSYKVTSYPFGTEKLEITIVVPASISEKVTYFDDPAGTAGSTAGK